MNYFNNFLFEQYDITKRQNWLYYSLLVTILILILLGPYHVLAIDYAEILFKKEITIGGMFDVFLKNKLWYFALRYSIVIFLLFSIYKKYRKWYLLITLILFHLFQYLHYRLTPYAWNYNTHLSFFLLILTVSYFSEKTKYNSLISSFSISFPIFYVGCLYFQSGLSKLIYGGVDWIITGRTVLQFSYFLGTDLGRYVLAIPNAAQTISFFSILIELSVIFLIFFPKLYKIIGVLMICFHLGIKLTMNISFWHLIILFPALFIIGQSGFDCKKA